MGFDIQILLGGNNITLAELGNHCLYPLVFVTCIVLLEFLDILCIDGCDNGFYRHRVDHLLEGVLLPLGLLMRLELEDLAPLGAVLDSWVDEIRFFEPLVVKVFVPGGKSHF